MIRKMASSIPGHVRVVFELPSCVWADRIHLTGDFNDWSQTSLPMHQDRDGVWRTVLDLPAGKRYQFRYLVDGRWHTDSHADGYEGTIYGSQNSVVATELPELETKLAASRFGSLLHENRLAVTPERIHHRMPFPPAMYGRSSDHAGRAQTGHIS